MINLLPLKQKQELRLEESFKLAIVLGILSLLFLICLYLVLFSVKAYIMGEVEAQKILLVQKENEFNTPRTQAFKKSLISFNLTLSKLDSFYQDQFDLTEALEQISGTLPSDVYLTSLSFNPTRDKREKKILTNLSGFASTRQSLLDFRDSLEQETSFQDISFSQASWVKPTDINFTVSFIVK